MIWLKAQLLIGPVLFVSLFLYLEHGCLSIIRRGTTSCQCRGDFNSFVLALEGPLSLPTACQGPGPSDRDPQLSQKNAREPVSFEALRASAEITHVGWIGSGRRARPRSWGCGSHAVGLISSLLFDP